METTSPVSGEARHRQGQVAHLQDGDSKSCRHEHQMLEEAQDRKLRGLGIVVEVDECHLHTRKCHRGRELATEHAGAVAVDGRKSYGGSALHLLGEDCRGQREVKQVSVSVVPTQLRLKRHWLLLNCFESII